MKKNATLLLLAFIMVINALAYGTIIPLLYPYAERFGINAFGLSLLFASFSLAQFIATPILGRISDRVGRKPVLLFCLLGTGISLALFASAISIAMLFIARIVDGITGGNISVAQAMIADSTKGKDRAKAFGILGATFGFGFIAGPGIGGLLSKFGITAPFWFAAVLAFIGTIAGMIVLKETLPKEQRRVSKEPMFHFGKIFKAVLAPLTGIILLINFVASLAQNAFVIGVQALMNDTLKLDPTQIGIVFVAVGIMNIVMTIFGIRILLNKVKVKKYIVIGSQLLASIAMFALSFQFHIAPFIAVLLVFGIFLSPLVPVLTGLLSEYTRREDQGEMLGINQSYTSIAQIVGPLCAGVVAAKISVPAVFVMSSLFLLAGMVISFVLPKKESLSHKVDL